VEAITRGSEANEFSRISSADLAGVELAMPMSAVEAAIANIWAAQLGANAVGRGDGFFALGGNSLQATILVSRLQPSFEDTGTMMARFFQNPTVAGFSQTLMAAAANDADRVLAILHHLQSDGPSS